MEATGVKFRLTPADYLYSWHTAPQRQFIVNLDGDVEIEVTSGERKIIKQGEVFFVEDVTGISCLQHMSMDVLGRALTICKGGWFLVHTKALV